MSLSVERADWFKEDFDRQYRWYLERAGEAVAERYLAAVQTTIDMLCKQPELGRLRCFRNPKLRDLRSFRVARPYNKHLLFYRPIAPLLHLERVMHGTRDLPRRLVNPPS